MKISAVYSVPGKPDSIFSTVTDPLALKECIPGCERLEIIGEGEFEAVLKVGIAGLKGTYQGKAGLSDLNPPQSFSLAFEGKGGPGFVRGNAVFSLTETGGATQIQCVADVQVGGAIVAVGSRLVQAAARKMMDEFIKCLTERLDRTDTE